MFDSGDITVVKETEPYGNGGREVEIVAKYWSSAFGPSWVVVFLDEDGDEEIAMQQVWLEPLED